MRKVFIIIAVFCVSFANAQAFKGKGDLKGQVGLTLQDGGTGKNVNRPLAPTLGLPLLSPRRVGFGISRLRRTVAQSR